MGKIENMKIKLADIEVNDGQITGLAKNPRWWSFDDVEKLKKSIRQTPELLEARGIIVYPYNGKFVAIGGNLRLVALKSLGESEAPCFVLPADTSIDKLREIIIKDNGSFGSWNEVDLQKEWEDCPFDEWGIDIFPAEEHNDDKPVHEQDGKETFSVTFNVEEYHFVASALRELDKDKEQALLQLIGDE